MHATSLGQLWHEVITAEPLPPRLLVLGTAVAALILVGWRRAWPVSRTVVTIAHEKAATHWSRWLWAAGSTGCGCTAAWLAVRLRPPAEVPRVPASWPPPRPGTCLPRSWGWARPPSWPPGT